MCLRFFFPSLICLNNCNKCHNLCNTLFRISILYFVILHLLNYHDLIFINH